MGTLGDLRHIQQEQAAWATDNFGSDRPSYQPLLGVAEEVGELAHAHLKNEQGIRQNEDHRENKRDAIGDVVIYLMDYCNLEGFDLQSIIIDTWVSVRGRDWVEDPSNGGSS